MKKDRTTGQIIKDRRTALGLTQIQLAEKIGLSYQQVQKYEKGIDRVSVERLKQMARALDTPVSAFFPSDNGMVAEEPAAYGRLNADEEELLRLFRGIKDKKQRSAVIALLTSLSRK
ncbi:MAG: hypothetical protein A2072_08820 [Nitrospirae bacterium GWC1_57_7]|nr:MAG: hypothetical protein A2072_08820 [Nitrospirae bacterium GWC1_57_7]